MERRTNEMKTMVHLSHSNGINTSPSGFYSELLVTLKVERKRNWRSKRKQLRVLLFLLRVGQLERNHFSFIKRDPRGGGSAGPPAYRDNDLAKPIIT